MKQLWAPWRIQYILKEKPEGCFFCQGAGENNDGENYILYRGKKNFIILNSYPYNPGHLMVVPYRHVPDLEALDNEELLEHFDLVRKGTKLLGKALDPSGFNVGINLGKLGRVGIEDHLHTHIVPRWQGDSNFMPAIFDTRVIPEALVATYEKLKQHMDEL